MNEDIRVIDSLLPKVYQDALEETITGELFEWSYAKDVVWQHYHDKIKQVNDGLNHILHVPNFEENESEHWPLIKPMLYYIEEQSGLKINKLLRARVGLLQRAYPTDLLWNNEHVDNTFPHYTAIYYVNDSDGPTYIFDQRITDVPHPNKTSEQIIKYVNNTEFTPALASEPKKGKCVIFDGQRFHSSSKPKNHSNRIVISFNWK